MIDANWDLSPDEATELVRVALIGQKWRNPETRQYWDMNKDFAGYYKPNSPLDEAEVLATRPTQIKTVADAVEQEIKKWTHAYNGEPCRIVVGESDKHGKVLIEGIISGYLLRKELELKPNILLGKKFTHIVETTSKKCLLLSQEPDYDGCYAILLSDGTYDIEHGDFLKPIDSED